MVSVKFAAHIGVYVTGTSKGEIKLWNRDGGGLGAINGEGWDGKGVMDIIQGVRKENKQRELLMDQKKIDEMKRRISLTFKG